MNQPPDYSGLDQRDRLILEIAKCGRYRYEDTESRWLNEEKQPGWNVWQDVIRFHVSPHVYSDEMERLYKEGDGFIFETLQYWRTPDRKAWSERGLLRLHAYCQERHIKASALRVLMLGDGGGSDTLYLLSAGFRPHYFDVPGSRTAAFSEARFRNRGISDQIRLLNDYGALLTQHYDAVWCFDVIEHLQDLPQAVADMGRMIRPNGVLLLTQSCSFIRADLPTHLQINLVYNNKIDQLLRRGGLWLHQHDPRTGDRPAEYRKLTRFDLLGRLRAYSLRIFKSQLSGPLISLWRVIRVTAKRVRRWLK